jgi:hypothetical protein
MVAQSSQVFAIMRNIYLTQGSLVVMVALPIDCGAALKSRHPGGGRDPGASDVSIDRGRAWIPAYAGMTAKKQF